MGRPFLEYCEDDDVGRYTCGSCGADLASTAQIVWSGYMGQPQKPAFLLRSTTANVAPTGAQREETLQSGRYILQDLACRSCGTPLGWLYVKCFAGPDHSYKEGCSLFEQAALRAAPSRNSLAQARELVRAMQARASHGGSGGAGRGSGPAGGPFGGSGSGGTAGRGDTGSTGEGGTGAGGGGSEGRGAAGAGDAAPQGQGQGAGVSSRGQGLAGLARAWARQQQQRQQQQSPYSSGSRDLSASVRTVVMSHQQHQHQHHHQHLPRQHLGALPAQGSSLGTITAPTRPYVSAAPWAAALTSSRRAQGLAAIGVGGGTAAGSVGGSGWMTHAEGGPSPGDLPDPDADPGPVAPRHYSLLGGSHSPALEDYEQQARQRQGPGAAMAAGATAEGELTNEWDALAAALGGAGVDDDGVGGGSAGSNGGALQGPPAQGAAWAEQAAQPGSIWGYGGRDGGGGGGDGSAGLRRVQGLLRDVEARLQRGEQALRQRHQAAAVAAATAAGAGGGAGSRGAGALGSTAAASAGRGSAGIGSGAGAGTGSGGFLSSSWARWQLENGYVTAAAAAAAAAALARQEEQDEGVVAGAGAGGGAQGAPGAGSRRSMWSVGAVGTGGWGPGAEAGAAAGGGGQGARQRLGEQAPVSWEPFEGSHADWAFGALRRTGRSSAAAGAMGAAAPAAGAVNQPQGRHGGGVHAQQVQRMQGGAAGSMGAQQGRVQGQGDGAGVQGGLVLVVPVPLEVQEPESVIEDCLVELLQGVERAGLGGSASLPTGPGAREGESAALAAAAGRAGGQQQQQQGVGRVTGQRGRAPHYSAPPMPSVGLMQDGDHDSRL